MFGRSSEKIEYVDCKQLDFFNEVETYCDAAAPEPGKTVPVTAYARKAKRTKAELTEGMEHQKVLCELPEEEQICAKCGTKMTPVGEKYVRTELIIVPAKISVIDYYVATYKCAHCEKEVGESYIEQAKAPVPVMKKSMAAASTVVYVMQEKTKKVYLFTGRKNTGKVKVLISTGTQWQTGLFGVRDGLFRYGISSGKNSWNATL